MKYAPVKIMTDAVRANSSAQSILDSFTVTDRRYSEREYARAYVSPRISFTVPLVLSQF